MTKGKPETKLRSGWLLCDLLDFGPGEEDFTIYKAGRFLPGDDVIYIPAAELNMLPLDRLVTGAEIDKVMGSCYTGGDFVEECKGDAVAAERLFYMCRWQHPNAEDVLCGTGEDEEDWTDLWITRQWSSDTQNLITSTA